jgi:hypothetical protein
MKLLCNCFESGIKIKKSITRIKESKLATTKKKFFIFFGSYPRVKSTIVSFSFERLYKEIQTAIKKVIGKV